MSRFLLSVSRNWIGEEFYGSKYALHVAAPHAVSPFLHVKCMLFACSANPSCPRAAAYANSFLQALRSGAVDGDLVQYIEAFDRSNLGSSPGLRKKDENEMKIIRSMTPMQHRTMIYDAIKAAVFLRGAPQTDQVIADFLRRAANGNGNGYSNNNNNNNVAAVSAEPKHEQTNTGAATTIITTVAAAAAQSIDGNSSASSISNNSRNANGSSGATGSNPLTAELKLCRIRGRRQQGHPDQIRTVAEAKSTATDVGEKHDALDSLRVVFTENEVSDLNTLSKELGLAPDVVIKAYEISIRERNLMKRKHDMFWMC